MHVREVEQGTEEWLRLRRGKPTASEFSRVFTAAKAELSSARFGYIDDLIAEAFFPDGGAGTDGANSHWMGRGADLEPEARLVFEGIAGVPVEQAGIIVRDGCICQISPDGMLKVGDSEVWNAGVEIKCPAPKTHVKYVRLASLPSDYKQQVHGSMVVTGFKQWHFFSYCPGMRPFHLVVKRDGYTEKLSKGLDTFVKEYKEAWNKIVPDLQEPKG